jgi:hypothetical protein
MRLQEKTVKWLVRSASVLLLIAAFVVVIHPEVRTSIRTAWKPNTRIVLSTVFGDLNHDGLAEQVIKLRDGDGIFIEIYASASSGPATLLARLNTAHKKDAFFTFNGEATNLALDDIDADGKPEILVPSFASDNSSQLSIYSFDPVNGYFREVN